MKIKEVKLLEFNELSPEQKTEVINKYRDINTDFDWYSYIYDEFIEQGEAFGLSFDDIKSPFYFNGFYSQGDGACISDATLDVFTFIGYLKKNKPDSFVKVKTFYSYLVRNKDLTFGCNIEQSGHYYHSQSMRYSFNMDTILEQHPKLSRIFDVLENIIKEFIEDYCDKLYKELETQYAELISDESVAENLILNEYTFNECTLDIDYQ